MRSKAFTARGRVTVVEKSNGRVISRRCFNNMVVTGGYQAMIGTLAGEAGIPVADLVIGTDPTLPAFTDADLVAQEFLKVITLATQDGLSITITATVLQGEGNGFTYYEWGLKAGDGTLIARAVPLDGESAPVPYEKTDAKEFDVTWTIEFVAP